MRAAEFFKFISVLNFIRANCEMPKSTQHGENSDRLVYTLEKPGWSNLFTA